VPILGEVRAPHKPLTCQFAHAFTQDRNIFTAVGGWRGRYHFPNNRPRMPWTIRMTFSLSARNSPIADSSAEEGSRLTSCMAKTEGGS